MRAVRFGDQVIAALPALGVMAVSLLIGHSPEVATGLGAAAAAAEASGR